ncbi:hypothetical protein DPEC_G00184190 [Dallia pectoralis]|uniref:Uncharacterized protein n=1 Tax=Dallia pectoralis TaxID=75939 RepID=A0ACC2GAZ9_DALPE|nr:hypothetical protein DPEC_G00184190 [Dallia pectoralis]
MSVNGSFHVQLNGIMETLTTSAVAEITKLVEYSSALLFSEISRQRGENEALRKAMHRMEVELRTGRPKSNERSNYSVDACSEVQQCDETQNNEAVSDQWFLDKQLDVCERRSGGDNPMETGETSSPLVFTVKKEYPEVEVVIPNMNDGEASHPENGGHLSGEAHGVLSAGHEHQAPEVNQSKAHNRFTAEPPDDKTSQVSEESEIWVKSELGSESESEPVPSGPAGVGNRAQGRLAGTRGMACSYCDKRFDFRSQLIIHERVHTRERPFVCKQCGKGFSQINNLTKHQLSHKGGDGEHDCDECGKAFRHSQSLRNHAASAHSFGEASACEKCGKTFYTKNALLAHTNSHARTFCCEICGKVFGKKQILKSHQFTHTGERPFICDYCGKSFAFLCNLKTHERVHTGEKPFGCERCGRRFTQKHVLEKHLCKA